MPDTLKMTVEARSVNEGFARAAVAAFAARLDPNLEELADIKTAVSEAVTNCIVHAYPQSPGLIHITVRTDAEKGTVRIAVRDTGVGIADVAQARQAMFTTGGPDRSGMGFTVMESFMDKVEVKSTVGEGTTVRLIKRVETREEALPRRA